jgi:hypothetical protein
LANYSLEILRFIFPGIPQVVVGKVI